MSHLLFISFIRSTSKKTIDRIDEVIAQHYGFTEEELDFIINYDIKYRTVRNWRKRIDKKLN